MGSVVDNERIEELPLNGRNATDLIAILHDGLRNHPGVLAEQLRGNVCDRRDRVQLRLRGRSNRFTELRRLRCPVQRRADLSERQLRLPLE